MKLEQILKERELRRRYAVQGPWEMGSSSSIRAAVERVQHTEEGEEVRWKDEVCADGLYSTLGYIIDLHNRDELMCGVVRAGQEMRRTQLALDAAGDMPDMRSHAFVRWSELEQEVCDAEVAYDAAVAALEGT